MSQAIFVPEIYLKIQVHKNYEKKRIPAINI